MKTEKETFTLEFTEPLLGTASGNPEVHQEFIASKCPTVTGTAEEVQAVAVEDAVEKAMTIFPKDDKGIFMWDYQWRGYFKECMKVLIETGQLKHLTNWSYKKAVDNLLFVNPRKVYLLRDGEVIQKPDGRLQRPLRADTMKGERVALANSECVHPPFSARFEVVILEAAAKSKWREVDMDTVRDCLDLGQFKGTGQWRSGGYGRFKVVES